MKTPLAELLHAPELRALANAFAAYGKLNTAEDLTALTREEFQALHLPGISPAQLDALDCALAEHGRHFWNGELPPEPDMLPLCGPDAPLPALLTPILSPQTEICYDELDGCWFLNTLTYEAHGEDAVQDIHSTAIWPLQRSDNPQLSAMLLMRAALYWQRQAEG